MYSEHGATSVIVGDAAIKDAKVRLVGDTKIQVWVFITYLPH